MDSVNQDKKQIIKNTPVEKEIVQEIKTTTRNKRSKTRGKRF